MKRNSLTILVGVLLVLIFILLLFTFQVRQTEIALVTTFDKPSGYITNAGFNWKWPPPIQRVYRFDKRVQLFDNDTIEESYTEDNFNLILQVYIGWKIAEPAQFFSSFPSGTVAAAQPALSGLIRGAKTAVVGRHPFSHFVSTDPNELKLEGIEEEMLKAIQGPAAKNYGIDVTFLGVKKLSLPESVTQKVFDRMTAERQAEAETLRARGEAEANRIRSEADRQRQAILAEAEAKATVIRGQADAEAAKSFEIFEQNPDLAIFLGDLRALQEVTKDRTTIFLDGRTRPFGLMTSPLTNELPSLTTNQPQSQITSPAPAPVPGETKVSQNLQ